MGSNFIYSSRSSSRLGSRTIGCSRSFGPCSISPRSIGSCTIGSRSFGSRSIGSCTIGLRPIGSRPIGPRPISSCSIGSRSIGCYSNSIFCCYPTCFSWSNFSFRSNWLWKIGLLDVTKKCSYF